MDYIELSKDMAYILRHGPDKYNLTLDKKGFLSLDELLMALNQMKKYQGCLKKDDLLKATIPADDKKRFLIVGNLICCTHGHSLKEKIEKVVAIPPAILYHGTTSAVLPIILKEGLKPMNRQYVHLSPDLKTAYSVGQRRDENPVILEVDTVSAINDGYKFYIGDEDTWLSDEIPPKYLKIHK